MSIQHANRGIVKKDLQLYYNREFVKSFRGEATINTCDLNTRYNYVWANGVVTRDTTAPSPPPITGFEIAKLRSTDGADTQTILYTASVDQVNGGVYTHSAYIYLESGTWVSVGQHWNPWNYGVQTYIPLNKWTRVSFTVTNSAANYGQVACSYNTNGTIYITATQYERKSYSTPFVNGSRTANTIAGGGGLLDISGNNVNADLTNVLFNSSGYYFNAASSTRIIAKTYTATDTFWRNLGAISIWFKTSTNQNGTLVGWGDDGSVNFGSIQITADWTGGYADESLIAESYNATASQRAVIRRGNNYYANGIWNNVTAVFDDNYLNLMIYINGVLETTSNNGSSSGAPFLNVSTSTSYFNIGRRTYGAGTEYFTGEIGQVLVYGKILTAAEVLQNFNATRKTYGI